MSPFIRFGVFPGISTGEVERQVKRRGLAVSKAKVQGTEAMDALWYILDDDANEHTGLMIRGGVVVAITEYVEFTIDAQQAADIFADYTRYICWRFSALSRPSTLSSAARLIILGRVEIYDSIRGADENLVMDVFHVEDKREEGGRRFMAVYSLPDAF